MERRMRLPMGSVVSRFKIESIEIIDVQCVLFLNKNNAHKIEDFKEHISSFHFPSGKGFPRAQVLVARKASPVPRVRA